MRWQCAGHGQRLASPPCTQRSVHCPELRHGGVTAKSVCPISGGGILTAHHGLFFLFFETTVQLTKEPFIPPHLSGAQECCHLIDALPPQLLLHLFANVSLDGACIVCWQHAVLWQGWHRCKEVPSPPPSWHKGGCICPLLSHGRYHCKELSPHFWGRDSGSTRWIGIFFSTSCSVY